MLQTVWYMHRMKDVELKIPKVTLKSQIGGLDQKIMFFYEITRIAAAVLSSAF